MFGMQLLNYLGRDLETQMAIFRGIGQKRKKILLLHGFASTKEIMYMFPLLDIVNDYIAYDQRGFGKGVAKRGDYHFKWYVSDAIHMVNYHKPDLIIGHSYGGIIAAVVSAQTGVPAISLETTCVPPKSIKESENAKEFLINVFNHARFINSIMTSQIILPRLLVSPYALKMYEPPSAMPAMNHVDQMIDFKDQCKVVHNRDIRVFGGIFDQVISRDEVEYFANCIGTKPVFKPVDHVGVLNPSFVMDVIWTYR